MADCDKSSPGGRYILTFLKWTKSLKVDDKAKTSPCYCKQCQLMRMFCEAFLRLLTSVCWHLGLRQVTMVNFTQPVVGYFPMCRNDDPLPQPVSNRSSYNFYMRLGLKGGTIKYVSL